MNGELPPLPNPAVDEGQQRITADRLRDAANQLQPYFQHFMDAYADATALLDIYTQPIYDASERGDISAEEADQQLLTLQEGEDSPVRTVIVALNDICEIIPADAIDAAQQAK